MAVNCAKLSGNLAMASCRSSVPGIKGEAIVFNYDDWKRLNITKTNSVISAITAPSGINGYRFTSHDEAFDGKVSMNKGTYINNFGHEVTMRAFDRTQTLKDDLNKMLNGRFVVIVINKDSNNPETVYEVYGEENGLEAKNIDYDSTNGDGVIYGITLGSPDKARESEVPTSIYTNSLAATKTMVDGLVAA